MEKEVHAMDYDFIEKIDSVNVHKGIRKPKFKKKDHHYHNWYEIFIVLKGSCRFSMYDKFYDVHAGSALLLEPGIFHYYTSDVGCEYVIIEITAGYISRFFSSDSANMLLKCFNSMLLPLEDDALSECVKFAEIADNESDASISDKFLAIGNILNIMNKASNNQSLSPAIVNSNRRSTLEKLNYITNYIAENFKEINSITELAKKCYISKSHMCRIFKQELGVSVSSYINNLKINSAREMLLTTNMSVLEIAVESGFNSPQYFHKTFKSQLGYSPKEYKDYHFLQKSLPDKKFPNEKQASN